MDKTISRPRPRTDGAGSIRVLLALAGLASMIAVIGLPSAGGTTRTATKQPGSQLLLVDATGSVLGPVLGESGTTFFSSTLGRIVTLNLDGSVTINSQAYFTTSDCSGTAYLDAGNGDITRALKLLKATVHNYYVVDPSTVPQSIHIGSGLLTDGSGCGVISNTMTGVAMTPVSLSFADPVVGPLHIVSQ